MKVCPSCGKNCGDSEFYCSNCGFPMNNVPAVPENNPGTYRSAGYVQDITQQQNISNGQPPQGEFNNQYKDQYHQITYYPYFPLYSVFKPKTDGFAVTSFVVGICSLILTCCSFYFLVASIAGLVFGIISIRRINKPYKNLTGKGLAIAGIVCSCLSFVFAVISLVVYLFAFSAASSPNYGPSWSL